MAEESARALPVAKDAATSLRMQRYAREDTKPELLIRSALQRRGLRFRKNFTPVTGIRCKPDVVFTRLRIAVFVDGCFWHQCPQHGSMPKNNADWWLQKLEVNSRRDRRIDAELRASGWTVIRVWEHESTTSVCDLITNLVGVVRADIVAQRHITSTSSRRRL